MSKNKIYTLSYFRKRLKDENIHSVVLVDKFFDNRYWMISIDNTARIICTCYKFVDENNIVSYHFHFSDGKQKIMYDKILKTSSMLVVIKTIRDILNVQTNTIGEHDTNKGGV